MFVSLDSWFSGFGFGFLDVVILCLLGGVTSAVVLVVGDSTSVRVMVWVFVCGFWWVRRWLAFDSFGCCGYIVPL